VVSAQTSNPAAALVLGQVDFTHSGANIVSRSSLYAPSAVAIDHSVIPNRIYVADPSDNRVLGWSNSSAFASGQAADLVIGQPDFLSVTCDNGGESAQTLCSPASVAVDSAGNLYVGDTGTNRYYRGAIGGSQRRGWGNTQGSRYT
jgi:NHL repeat